MAQMAAERECAGCAWQGVGRDCEPDEEPGFPRRGDSYREPCNRDRAHPVAERGDAEAQ